MSLWSLCVIDSFISLVQYANALLLAGPLSYCYCRSRAKWESAKRYSCLFRCAVSAAQQTCSCSCITGCEDVDMNHIHCAFANKINKTKFDVFTHLMLNPVHLALGSTSQITSKVGCVECIMQKVYLIRMPKLCEI